MSALKMCRPRHVFPVLVVQSILHIHKVKIDNDLEFSSIKLILTFVFTPLRYHEFLEHTGWGRHRRTDKSIIYMKGAGIAQLLYRLGKRLDDKGITVRFPKRLRDFVLLRSVQAGSGAHPSRRVLRTSSLGVKRPGREVDYSHPPCAEVKNVWS